ncbi:MAG: rRNA maturation RNase YbeY [Pseudomonadota bacterium]
MSQSCEAALAHGGLKDSAVEIEISALLSDDEAIQALNRTYRGKDKPTNILSFPAFEAGAWASHMTPEQPLLLGDLALGFETVAREAREKSIAIEDYVAQLTVHGVLHLLGYDHHTQEDAARMEQLETTICHALGLPDPYAEEAA